MLDPRDWDAFTEEAHRMLDDAIEYLRTVRGRAVWQPIPEEIKQRLTSSMPQDGMPLDAVYREFSETILPYATGNVHPRFWGWVHGTGTPTGALAELLAATMNSNVGGRDHAAVYVERAVIRWFCELFEWPASASGVLVTGTSVANLIGVLVARTNALGREVREDGLYDRTPLVGYASSATHGCVRRAFENSGLGSGHLRVLPIDAAHRLDPAVVAEAIARDRSAGLQPFLIVGNAGTVDVGAIDPLEQLADLAQREGLWFHVDGAFGATAYLSPRFRPALRGIERADSLAFDFHKWLHVPYDAGCALIRDGEMQRRTFASEGPYLTRMDRGLAAGAPWFTDYGLDLSRGFRALKVWFTLKEHGTRRIGDAIEANCDQARHLAAAIERDPAFELMAPVALNIVCFRPHIPDFTAEAADRLTDEIAIELQESGVAVISATTIDGKRALRCCITNHRTRGEDLDVLVTALREILQRRLHAA